jgi:hypothetical protein
MAMAILLAASSTDLQAASPPPAAPIVAAKAVTVERIKVHGAALEGNLEGESPNAPLSMLDQYVFNLRRYQAIAIDVGDRDGLRVDAADLHARMDVFGVGNTFEIYSGDHGNAVASRFQNNVLPFFGRVLHSSGE